jgi:hypothetical protein
MMKANEQMSRSCGLRADARSGYTLIELIEFIIAAAIANTLAHRLAANYEGATHTAILWGVTIMGTLIFGFGIMISFAYLIDIILRLRARGQGAVTKEKNNDAQP